MIVSSTLVIMCIGYIILLPISIIRGKNAKTTRSKVLVVFCVLYIAFYFHPMALTTHLNVKIASFDGRQLDETTCHMLNDKLDKYFFRRKLSTQYDENNVTSSYITLYLYRDNPSWKNKLFGVEDEYACITITPDATYASIYLPKQSLHLIGDTKSFYAEFQKVVQLN